MPSDVIRPVSLFGDRAVIVVRLDGGRVVDVAHQSATERGRKQIATVSTALRGGRSLAEISHNLCAMMDLVQSLFDIEAEARKP